MSDFDPEESARIAGQLVSFVCLDAGKSSAADFRFDVRCHFIPRVGERFEHKKKIFEVVRVYHRTVFSPAVDDHHFLVPNVVCQFLRDAPEKDEEVDRLLRSLSD